jgi:hypothetical protein
MTPFVVGVRIGGLAPAGWLDDLTPSMHRCRSRPIVPCQPQAVGVLAEGWGQVENPIHLNLCQGPRDPGCGQHEVPQEPDLIIERLVGEFWAGVQLHDEPPAH